MKTIWFVIPAYNEEQVIFQTAKQLVEILDKLIIFNKITIDSRILFVDDGSTDNTWKYIEQLNNENSRIKGLKLIKNMGQQNAIYVGYEYAYENSDAVISFDIDLQDDISILDNVIEKYEKEHYEMVLVTHNDRKTDSFLKSFTANIFYSFYSLLGGKILKNHSEYRLLSQKVLSKLLEYDINKIFLRSFVFELSDNFCIIEAKRKQRIAGTPKYNFLKSFKLALFGILCNFTKTNFKKSGNSSKLLIEKEI